MRRFSLPGVYVYDFTTVLLDLDHNRVTDMPLGHGVLDDRGLIYDQGRRQGLTTRVHKKLGYFVGNEEDPRDAPTGFQASVTRRAHIVTPIANPGSRTVQ
jgi:hypothetical protein